MVDYDPTKESTSTLQLRLAKHVLLKGWQAGSLVGLVVVVPAQAVYTRSFSLLAATCSCGIASLVGVGATAVLLGMKMQSIDRPGYEDRVYRLYHNKGQNRLDLLSGYGSAAGLAASVAAASSGALPMSLLPLVGGAAAGSAVGVLYHVATMPKQNKQERRQMARTVLEQTTGK